MLIVRGVNVFPSQIEHALVRLAGLAPHYQLILSTRADRQDELRVRIEPADHAGVETADADALAARARAVLRDALGIQVLVELVAPGAIPRSEGKAVRVLDERTR
jgi:phenylacetate-CoA ligase